MKILVPIDGSEHSIRAAKYATQLATPYPELEVTLLAVVNPFEERLRPRKVHSSYEGLYDRTLLDKLTEHSQKDLEKALAVFKDTGIQVQSVIQYGDSADVIVQYAEENDIDQIVMGCRGLGAFQSMILGSVSYKVLGKVQVPVILIK